MVIYFKGNNNITINNSSNDYNTLVNNIKQTEEGWWYVENNSEIILYDYKGLETEIKIPNFINDKPVTTIGRFAFFGHNQLSRIDFSQTIEHVDKFAFALSRSIYIITIPLTYELAFTVIEPVGPFPLIVREHEFEDINYDDLEYDLNKAYHGVTADKIKQNDDFVYYDNGSTLEILTIKNNDEIIIIPSKINNKNVEIISSNAFYDKDGIVKEIIISEGIKHIMPNAFDGRKLEKMYIPSSVNIINYHAISSWSDNLTIYVYAKQKPLNWDSSWYYKVKYVIWDVKDYNSIID